jgi:tripartite-type tricarboxylate transporter receptor subunit TctC
MEHKRNVLRTSIAIVLSATLIAISTTSAQAQSFSKPVRVITPFPAGAGPDAATRVVGEQLTKKWGQPVVVDNKPGGNGFIAVSTFKGAPTDNHTLLVLDSSHTTTHPHTFEKLPYDVEKDFQPIGMILRTPFFIAVAADSPYKTLEDIVTAAKNNPDNITYGSWFIGSPGHIGALRLQSLRNISMRHVPYRDFGQLYAAVATKEVDWALGSAGSAGPMERSGRIRFIAVAAPSRDPLYPNVPATAEMPNLASYDVNAWVGIFAPRSMPSTMVDRIATDLREALDSKDVVDRYKTFGYESPRLSPSAFGQLMQKETAGWSKIIKSANLKLD